MSVNLITRVLRAEQSSNLAESGPDIDFVRAAGLAGVRRRLGSYLPRFLATGGSDYRDAIIQTLVRLIGGQHPSLTKLERLAVATGAAYLYLVPRCCACSGRGFELRPDTPTLSDVQCQACKGTGRNELDHEKKLGPALHWAQNEIQTAEQAYSAAVGRKLGRD
jgi:hypothetical protein